jgi:uncharacterized protein (TIGR02284 family)
MQNEKNSDVVSALNPLMEINNDRVEGYKHALKETEDTDLKNLFKDMAEHSFKFKNELADEIIKAGGEPTGGTTNSGKLYRAWMDLKAAVTQKDRAAILSSCEFGEDAAHEVYEMAAKKDDLPQPVKNLIEQQRQSLHADHLAIKQLRDSQKSK